MSSDQSILEHYRTAAQAAASAFSDALGIVSLEAQKVAISLIGMLALALSALVFVITLWAMLWAAGSVALLQLGLDWVWILLASALVQGALIGFCCLLILRLSRNFRFPASRKALALTSTQSTRPE